MARPLEPGSLAPGRLPKPGKAGGVASPVVNLPLCSLKPPHNLWALAGVRLT